MRETDVLTKTESAMQEPIVEQRGDSEWPRITVVTAVRNGAKYIERTIRSVIEQGYPNLEYMVVDGASTDGTVDIIRKYEKDLSWWTSEPDRTVYEALNKGFSRSTGEIMGWLNASDMLHAGALYVVGTVFREFPEVRWITGRPTMFSEMGMTIHVRPVPQWTRARFLLGANKHIQQESTYWRRSLWDEAGGYVDAKYRDVGDFELWLRFFRHARLQSVDALVGGYRFHADGISRAGFGEYTRGCDEIVETELGRVRWGRPLRVLHGIDRFIWKIPKMRWLWSRLGRVVLWGLYSLPGPDWMPVIENQRGQWMKKRRWWAAQP